MRLEIPQNLLEQIHTHGEEAYPEEGAGLLLGSSNGSTRVVRAVLELTNAREDAARHNRYLLTAQDMMRGEDEAIRLGMDIIGVFHSHPDHPSRPSEFDLEWAMPWFSYVITSVNNGRAVESRSWRLSSNRREFTEEVLQVSDPLLEG
jgi:proteasome lid subunit RPN8/RPN11